MRIPVMIYEEISAGTLIEELDRGNDYKLIINEEGKQYLVWLQTTTEC